jgi:hypothetical protein
LHNAVFASPRKIDSRRADADLMQWNASVEQFQEMAV